MGVPMRPTAGLPCRVGVSRAAGKGVVLLLAALALLGLVVLWALTRVPVSPDVAGDSADLPAENAYDYLAASGELFRSVPAGSSRFAPAPTTGAAPERIHISLAAAQRAATTGVLHVTLPNRTRYPVRYERQETTATGNWTFVGRVSTRIGALAAVITFGRDGVFGVLPAPDGQMLHIVTIRGESYIQPAGGLLPTGTPASTLPDDAVAHPHRQNTSAAGPPYRVSRPTASSAVTRPSAKSIQPAQGGATARARPVPVAAAAALVQIDVLGVYTTNLVTLRGSVAAAETEFTNLVAVANQAHTDSGTIARLRLVAMRQVDYPAATFNSVALDAIRTNAVAGANLHALRDQYAADLVAMLRPYAPGDDSCGIAYLNAPFSSSETGYSVTATESCGPLVLAHEIGHNLGSHHDIETTGGAFGAYPFSVGYRQDGPPAFGTVMAYTVGSQSWIGYFSNPRINSCLGARCGIEDQADNVRSIGLMADKISRFRDPPNTISVLDAEAAFEPDAGVAVLTFEVRLSSPAPVGGVTFDIATGGAGGTAVAGSDYRATSLANQVIPQGERSYQFIVSVLPDTVVEGDETVPVTLSNVHGMALFDGAALGTIRNDDPRVRVSGRISVPSGMPPLTWPPYISACSILELPIYASECASTQVATDSYSISVLRGSNVTLDIYPGEPYAAQTFVLGAVSADMTHDIQLVRPARLTGRVKWPSGEPAPSGSVYVFIETPYPGGGYQVSSYQVTAPDYEFRFNLAPGTSAVLGAEATAPYARQVLDLGPIKVDVVRDVELRRVPSISIGHAAVTEGYGNSAPLVIRLSGPAPAGGVRFRLTTFDGSAMSDNDYQASTVDIDVPEGEWLYRVDNFWAKGDAWKEPEEVFGVTARNIVNAWLPANGFVRVVDDDFMVAPEWVPWDFGGIGFADVVWRNGNTGAMDRWHSGEFLIRTPLESVPDKAWVVAGIGDFDNDLQSDLLWRNTASGRNTIWLYGEGRSQRAVASMTDLAWRVAGVGDFNGDERSDILWRHARSGANTVWKSANAATVQGVTAVTNPAWTVAGVGDFDNDDRDDILWRNASTGANVIWRSANGGTQMAVTAVTNLDWRVARVADFDGDGRADILWRNRRTGANVIWRSGSSSSQQAVAAVANLDWDVQGAADYDRDGKADLLWRNLRTGGNAIWLSANSATPKAMPAVPLTWQLVR